MNSSAGNAMQSILSVIIFVVVVGGGYYFYRSTINGADDFLSFVQSGTPVKAMQCTISRGNFDENLQAFIYADGDRLSVTYHEITKSISRNVHAIIPEKDSMYVWSDLENNRAYKVPRADLLTLIDIPNEIKMGTLICHPWWMVDDSVFKVPVTVESNTI